MEPWVRGFQLQNAVPLEMLKLEQRLIVRPFAKKVKVPPLLGFSVAVIVVVNNFFVSLAAKLTEPGPDTGIV
jgi:hypothetical protein